MKTAIALFLLLFASVFCHAEKSVIVKQPDSPVLITTYTATYLSGEIYHTAIVTNASGKEVVRVVLGFVLFDAFDDFFDSFSGWSLETIKSNTRSGFMEWKHNPPAMFRFTEHGTGITYVKAVRFADGTTWKADMETVSTEMQKLVKSSKKDDLQKEKDWKSRSK